MLPIDVEGRKQSQFHVVVYIKENKQAVGPCYPVIYPGSYKWPKVRPFVSHIALLMTLRRFISAEGRRATETRDLSDEDGGDGGKRPVRETLEGGNHLR